MAVATSKKSVNEFSACYREFLSSLHKEVKLPQISKTFRKRFSSIRKHERQIRELLETWRPGGPSPCPHNLTEELRGGAECLLRYCGMVENARFVPVATAPFVRDEIQAMKKEFPKIQVTPTTITAWTGPITLTDEFGDPVDFKPFMICGSISRFKEARNVPGSWLWVDQQGKDRKYDKAGSHYHPHIQVDGSICLGEVKASFVESISSGRLLDAFLLARGCLTHYTHEQGYRPLSEWQRFTPCDDCTQPCEKIGVVRSYEMCGKTYNICERCWNHKEDRPHMYEEVMQVNFGSIDQALKSASTRVAFRRRPKKPATRSSSPT